MSSTTSLTTLGFHSKRVHRLSWCHRSACRRVRCECWRVDDQRVCSRHGRLEGRWRFRHESVHGRHRFRWPYDWKRASTVGERLLQGPPGSVDTIGRRTDRTRPGVAPRRSSQTCRSQLMRICIALLDIQNGVSCGRRRPAESASPSVGSRRESDSVSCPKKLGHGTDSVWKPGFEVSDWRRVYVIHISRRHSLSSCFE